MVRNRPKKIYEKPWCYLITNLFELLLLLLGALKQPALRVTRAHLTLALCIYVRKSQLLSQSFLRQITRDQKLDEANEKIRSNNIEKWRHARNSVEVPWTNKQKADFKWLWRHMVVTKILTKEKKREQVLTYNSEEI